MSILRSRRSLKVSKVLREYYKEPKRNNLTFSIAGFLHKARVPEQIIADIIERLAIAVNDEQLESRLEVVNNTYYADADLLRFQDMKGC